jgi:hypothetical protein
MGTISGYLHIKVNLKEKNLKLQNYRSNLFQLGVGGNDVLKNMLLTLMEYKGVCSLNLKKRNFRIISHFSNLPGLVVRLCGL